MIRAVGAVEGVQHPQLPTCFHIKEMVAHADPLQIGFTIYPSLDNEIGSRTGNTDVEKHPSLFLLPVVFRPLLPWLDDDEDGDNCLKCKTIFWKVLNASTSYYNSRSS